MPGCRSPAAMPVHMGQLVNHQRSQPLRAGRANEVAKFGRQFVQSLLPYKRRINIAQRQGYLSKCQRRGRGAQKRCVQAMESLSSRRCRCRAYVTIPRIGRRSVFVTVTFERKARSGTAVHAQTVLPSLGGRRGCSTRKKTDDSSLSLPDASTEDARMLEQASTTEQTAPSVSSDFA